MPSSPFFNPNKTTEESLIRSGVSSSTSTTELHNGSSLHANSVFSVLISFYAHTLSSTTYTSFGRLRPVRVRINLFTPYIHFNLLPPNTTRIIFGRLLPTRVYQIWSPTSCTCLPPTYQFRLLVSCRVLCTYQLRSSTFCPNVILCG